MTDHLISGGGRGKGLGFFLATSYCFCAISYIFKNNQKQVFFTKEYSKSENVSECIKLNLKNLLFLEIFAAKIL